MQRGASRRRPGRRGIGTAIVASIGVWATAGGSLAQSGQWDSILSNSYWYVPVPGLIAYASGNSSFYRPSPSTMGDQTLWALGQANNGVFSGQSSATFLLGNLTMSSSQSMQGLVTPGGQITIVFSSPGSPSTIGIGQMREVNGIPLMEMQMITGTSLLVTHWAYMTPYNPAVFTPPAPSQVVTTNVTSPQWRWTQGTTWTLNSPLLFGTAAPGTFKISNYSNGYYWGLGAAPPGSALGNFTILGSITPEGNVLFSLLSASGELTSLTGQVTGDASTGGMALRPYAATGAYGSASLAGIMPVSAIAAGQTYFISNVGSTVIPAFTGGTLQVDTWGETYGQNFTVDGSATNRLDQRGSSATLTGVLSDAVPGTPGQLVIANSAMGGSIVLAGANTYTGPTTVESGATLVVNGSIVSPLSVFGTLGGTGTVSGTTIAPGGILSPGNSIGTLTVNGNLAFAPRSAYLIEVAPGAADRTNVTGSASLQGTAVATFAAGDYFSPAPQVVLSAAGGRSGTFDSLSTLGLPPGLLASLSYTPSDVLLNLTAVLGAGTSLMGNQSAVASALNTSFNTGNSLPGALSGLFNQSGSALAGSLNTLTGEAQTGVQVAAFGYGNLFLNTVLGTGPGGASPQGVQYASLAATEAAPAPQRARGWLTGFGGYGWLGGTTGAGSSGVQTSAQGIAAGADWQFDHGLLGVAISGGTSAWYLDGGLGAGRSNAFQAGLYGRATFDPVYVAAAAAWGQHSVSVNRPVPFLADNLAASYTASTWSGQLEMGHRFALGDHGITPFAAGQAQLINLPGFCETSQTGSGAALCFSGNAAWSVRSELGLELDADVGRVLGSKASLTARLAWAHEYETTGSATAWFQSLPGSGFAVSGAPLPSDMGIVRVGSSLQLDPAWSLRLQADAEFGNNYGALAGTARLARRF
ncbi:autotransporter outer membrane beta-barrel domain-containing protein [Reyranella sp.]|uniref:autotransporter outer membrane beta-barrel domain-containing protein n=1 Tax=Reyranella sp. TaxID=1929291 RepID=UPI003BACC333